MEKVDLGFKASRRSVDGEKDGGGPQRAWIAAKLSEAFGMHAAGRAFTVGQKWVLRQTKRHAPVAGMVLGALEPNTCDDEIFAGPPNPDAGANSV